jgi:hypothetical protein
MAKIRQDREVAAESEGQARTGESNRYSIRTSIKTLTLSLIIYKYFLSWLFICIA